jgi:putative heme-binding domain-containing protein
MTNVAWSANPFDADPGAISAGAIMFGNRCAECHGADARGLIGKDLTVLWQAGVEDERVFRTIREGVASTVMPPSGAADKEIWAIVAYLKSISTVPPFTSETGDAERGREMFAAQCASCHHSHDAGGSLGPDLSRIALVRSRETLVGAIRAPDALVPADYRTVRLTRRDGAELKGIKKAEDAFSIQVLSTDEQLLGFSKSELTEIRREPYSLMPAFGMEQLDDGELEDLLAYMATLR